MSNADPTRDQGRDLKPGSLPSEETGSRLGARGLVEATPSPAGQDVMSHRSRRQDGVPGTSCHTETVLLCCYSLRFRRNLLR